MFTIECNYPGCKAHSLQSVPNADWNCGNHSQPSQAHEPGCAFRIWKEKHRYLPSRHPHRQNAPHCNCQWVTEATEDMLHHSMKYFMEGSFTSGQLMQANP